MMAVKGLRRPLRGGCGGFLSGLGGGGIHQHCAPFTICTTAVLPGRVKAPAAQSTVFMRPCEKNMTLRNMTLREQGPGEHALLTFRSCCTCRVLYEVPVSTQAGWYTWNLGPEEADANASAHLWRQWLLRAARPRLGPLGCCRTILTRTDGGRLSLGAAAERGLLACRQRPAEREAISCSISR